MKNNLENIPGFVFDWLEKNNFSSLRPEQQKQVLLYFSAEEYDELHQSVAGIKAVSKQETVTNSAPRKQALLQRFDRQHTTVKTNFVLVRNPLVLWKAAAIFLLAVAAWTSYRLVQQNPLQQQQLGVTADTVFITKEVPSEVKILDTVYLIRESKVQQKKNTTAGDKYPTRYTLPEPSSAGINILSVDEMDSLPNVQKHNSIKDDSLVKKFSFVNI